MIRHLHDYSLVAANIDILSKRALRKVCPRDQMADQLDFLLEIRLRNLRRCRSLNLGLIWFLRWCKGWGRRWFFQARPVKLAQDMDGFVAESRRGIPRAFESPQYAEQRSTIVQEAGQRQEAILNELREQAERLGFILQPGQTGIATIPALNPGQPMSPEAYQLLPDERKEEISARAQELTAELGSRYEVMLTNIKKYCVGFPIQSAIEGLLGLMGEHQLRADQVERITARLPESGARTVNDREMPDVNLQYAFAVTLLDGKLTFEAAHSFERMKDPRVLDLKKKVTLIGDPELSRARPEGQSIVQLITRDGRRLEKRVTTFKGRSENPLTTYEVEEKALELLEPVLGQSRTRQLMDTIGKLETLASVRDLRPLLQRG